MDGSGTEGKIKPQGGGHRAHLQAVPFPDSQVQLLLLLLLLALSRVPLQLELHVCPPQPPRLLLQHL